MPQGLPQDQFYAPHLWLVPAAQAVAAGVRHHRPGTDSDDWMMIGGLISVIFFYLNGPNMSQLPSQVRSLCQQPPRCCRQELLVHHGPHSPQHLRGQVLPEGRSADLIIASVMTMEGTELVYVNPF